MSSVYNSKNVLREKSLNFLNVPISEYLTQNRPSFDDQQYKTFQRNLQLQKQILNDQDDVHQYQTELFTKSVKQERVPVIINRPSVQHFRPTLTSDFAIPAVKSDTLIKQISKIDNDLEELATIFHQRKVMQKVLNILENHAERKQINKADQHRQCTLYKAFFSQMMKKQMISKFKRSLKM